MNCLVYVCKGVSKDSSIYVGKLSEKKICQQHRWAPANKLSIHAEHLGSLPSLPWSTLPTLWTHSGMPVFSLLPLMGLQLQSERHWTVSLENNWLLGWHWGVRRRKCDNATAVSFKKPYILSKIIFLIIKPVTFGKSSERAAFLQQLHCVWWGRACNMLLHQVKPEEKS